MTTLDGGVQGRKKCNCKGKSKLGGLGCPPPPSALLPSSGKEKILSQRRNDCSFLSFTSWARYFLLSGTGGHRRVTKAQAQHLGSQPERDMALGQEGPPGTRASETTMGLEGQSGLFTNPG